jgi:hypothetical protein
MKTVELNTEMAMTISTNQTLTKVEDGYALLQVNYRLFEKRSNFPLLEGKVKTVEIIKNVMGQVRVVEGPELSYDLPPWDRTANVGGFFIDESDGTFVECREEPDYGNGPGKARARVVRWLNAVIE